MEEEYPPNLKNLIENKEMKWIFVGGKGGVGKTTSSASIAVRMAKERENVLIISTDPAHNLSDAFDQKFSSDPVQVRGITNLFCMEIDPQKAGDSNEFLKKMGMEDTEDGGFLQELIGAVPGIDEATSFSEILRQVKEKEYDLIIFDTAPTGHTLRLLNFPSILEKALVKVMQLKEKFAPMISSFSGMMGGEGGSEDKIS
jgi:arsenite-transporting ATPase